MPVLTPMLLSLCVHTAPLCLFVGFQSFESNRMYFTTRDYDNDMSEDLNCAKEYSGGWWYNNCGHAFPNSVWNKSLSIGHVGDILIGTYSKMMVMVQLK